MRKYNAEIPKQGSTRFNSIVKTKYIANLGIVYLWDGCKNGRIWRRRNIENACMIGAGGEMMEF